MRRRIVGAAALVATVGGGLLASAGGRADEPVRDLPPGLLFLDYVDLGGGPDGVALIDADPASPDFGTIHHRLELGPGVRPHHLYFDRSGQRLYTTSLGGAGVYELEVRRDGPEPRLASAAPIDTGGQRVGEDMFFTEDGRILVTFLGGLGAPFDGSLGVFDADTNALLQVVTAPFDPTRDVPFLMFPHGLSVNERHGRVMVTSTVAPDLVSGAGNTVTTLDLGTLEPLSTQLVADGPEDLTAPVEVLLARDGLPDVAVVTTMLGGDLWTAPFEPATGLYGDFTKAFEGDDHGVAYPLELYVHTDRQGERELYVTFGVPGAVLVFDAEALPDLVLRRTLPAGPGAHHLVFFEDRAGRELAVVQDNLLELPGLDGHTLTVVDVHTGERVGEIDLANRHGLAPQSIESASGPSGELHH